MPIATPPAPSVERDELRAAIRDEYEVVAREPERGFHFHTGRALTEICQYGEAMLTAVPEQAIESFAGTGNPFRMGTISVGSRVVDVGCGAGMDSFIAASMVGPHGEVTGVDMTESMLARARGAANTTTFENLIFLQSYGEQLLVEDDWADVVISNGVFNLMPDKLASAREMARVLRPGGRLQLADILVDKPVAAKAKERIELWTG